MVARKRNARVVFIVAVIMFALIAAFMFWAAIGEANTIDSPVTTPIGTTVPTVGSTTAPTIAPTSAY